MESFNCDSPSLLNEIKLFALSGKAIWPIPQKRDWTFAIPVVEAAGAIGPDWWRQEIQDARAAQVKQESDRLTAYYAEQQRLKEERDYQEEKRWKNIDGAAGK
jgi:hypothetical protein